MPNSGVAARSITKATLSGREASPYTGYSSSRQPGYKWRQLEEQRTREERGSPPRPWPAQEGHLRTCQGVVDLVPAPGIHQGFDGLGPFLKGVNGRRKGNHIVENDKRRAVGVVVFAQGRDKARQDVSYDILTQAQRHGVVDLVRVALVYFVGNFVAMLKHL